MKSFFILLVISSVSLLMARSDPNVVYIRDFDKTYDKTMKKKITLVIVKMNEVISSMDGLREQADQIALREKFIGKYRNIVERDPLISEVRGEVDEYMDERIKSNIIKYEQSINNEKKVLR